MKQLSEHEAREILGEKAKKVKTKEDLFKFLDSVWNDYSYDYGSICIAMAAAAIATANAMNRDCKYGGISGLQAGAVQWEMIKLWGVFGEGPLSIVEWNNLLYPQYANKFNTIRKDVWEKVVEKAKTEVADISKNEIRHEGVLAHMRSVAEGKVPFGLRVVEDR